MIEFVDDVTQFGMVAFQELSPGGYIKEQVLHLEAGSNRRLYRFMRSNFRSGNPDLRTQFISLSPGFHGNLSHCSYGGQGLTPESLGPDCEQVFRS